ncbi:acyl-CoA synthetase family member 3, mitochondrial-like isoform X1 [Varroa jacobsoni]|uniref:acyl-CoA synthetase family member 3, mitochondrial-like isoform X1 n=1 Tax=Varroa jacobsoni TaxID=62625 RepID=UPI000BF8A075|nr:acyl-CoA synthetase family member 3, mitochondrial-like isoform X1 [Varroa jacobsoni]
MFVYPLGRGPSMRLLSRHGVASCSHSQNIVTKPQGEKRSVSCHEGFPVAYQPLVVRIASKLFEDKKESVPTSTITCNLGVRSSTDLLTQSLKFSDRLQPVLDNAATQTQIALLLPNDYRYIMSQWATWLSGACVVPLHQRLPPKMIEYLLQDSGSSVLITTNELSSVIDTIDKDLMRSIRVVSLNADDIDGLPEPASIAKHTLVQIRDHFQLYKKRPAQMVYTSGTTGPPKGVVTTHAALDAQASSVALDWFLGPEDYLLNHLPLHHTHGILNGLLSPLWAGSGIYLLQSFDPKKVWEVLLSEDNRVNFMLAVPTMYAQLVLFAKEQLWERREEIRDFLKLKLRLCTCGSAPLSLQLFRDWEELTGHVILERYGMTEFGMGVGGDAVNPKMRYPGTVGRPFVGLEFRIAEQDGYSSNRFKTLAHMTKHSTTIKTMSRNRIIGELHAKGPQMFSHYHERPKETKDAFTKDGWFQTGDMAELVICDDRRNLVKILGRKKMDFIKCGGYKVSALEVQNELEAVPGVAESAVFGVPDVTWGERVVAVVVPKKQCNCTDLKSEIQMHCKKTLPPTSIPSEITFVVELPRNVMGKIDKTFLRNQHLQRLLKESMP